MYNTRIAPSPTGDMHLGTARTAYHNFLMARASGGKFILRIDDTDAARSKQSHVDVILETMDWLGLDYDEIVYQSDRNDRYMEVIKQMDADDLVCELDNGAFGTFIERVPDEWTDEIAGDIIVSETDSDISSSLILMKSDGTPTYHFASVIDDMDFNINYIIRGHDHISNTPKQLNIMNNLGMVIPKFAHVGLIHKDGKKLSKRDGAASMLHYRDQGYDPDAMLNFLLNLGWAPTNQGKQHKIIDRDFALEIFINGGKLRNQSANMDLALLDSYNKKYKYIKRK